MDISFCGPPFHPLQLAISIINIKYCTYCTYIGLCTEYIQEIVDFSPCHMSGQIWFHVFSFRHVV